MARALQRRYGHMAYNRELYKDRIVEHLRGAHIEFYKAQAAEKNGYTRWVEHWRQEVRDLIDRASLVAVEHEVRGFKDRSRAAREAVAYVKAHDAQTRRRAEAIVCRDHGVSKLKVKLTDRDRDEFFKLVDLEVK